ncbi:hypothetical protein HMPREF9603_00143 [Cutibacterium acnes HL001PA1]|nr:hypothetical protein HMPREF9603_00143 [Cutibacterium acnes HL001PA1]
MYTSNYSTRLPIDPLTVFHTARYTSDSLRTDADLVLCASDISSPGIGGTASTRRAWRLR